MNAALDGAGKSYAGNVGNAHTVLETISEVDPTMLSDGVGTVLKAAEGEELHAQAMANANPQLQQVCGGVQKVVAVADAINIVKGAKNKAKKKVLGAIADEGSDAALKAKRVADKSKETADVVLSRPHRNKTPGHWEAIKEKTEEMAASGEYRNVYGNKGLKREVPDLEGTNTRPDVWGVRHDGKIDQCEVPSTSQTADELIDKMEDVRHRLGDRAGSIEIRPPKEGVDLDGNPVD